MNGSHRWWVLLLATALAGCECGAGPALDAGADAEADAGLDSGADAAVEDCGPAHPSVACVGGGWFELAKYWWYGESQLPDPEPIEPSPLADVHLPTFWIDRHEVTVERYAAAVDAGTVPAPPDSCGVRFIQAVGPYMEVASADEVSGWTAGEPYPARLDHPVVCVTREEAQTYCESRGGRLPRAAELMKAARGDGEGPRRFPWGDSPPEPGAHRGLIYAGTPDGWWLSYANIGLWRGEVDVALGTRPADSAAEGASPYGVLGLSGNVTEHVFECAVDLTSGYGGLSPERLVAPATPPWRAECPANTDRGDAYLLAGTNWASGPYSESLSMSVGRRLPLPSRVDRINAGIVPVNHVGGLRFSQTFWGAGEAPLDFADIPNERDRRSWFVGFRCAYDIAP